MNYPTYFKNGNVYYAVLSENSMITVNTETKSISTHCAVDYFLKTNYSKSTEITLLQFYEAMSEVHKDHFRMMIEAENKAVTKQLQTA